MENTQNIMINMKTADVNMTSSTSTAMIRLISDDVILYVTHIFTITMLVFTTIGIIGNVINMVVFSKLGFQDSINISLFCLSLSDFLVSIAALFNAIGTNPAVAEIHFPFSLPEMVVVFAMTPRIVFFKVTKMITAFVTLERCLCVVMPLKIKLFVTVTRVKVLMIVIFVSVFTNHIPMFMAEPLGWRFVPYLNRTVFTGLPRQKSVNILNVFLPVQAAIFSVLLYPFIITCTAVLIINLQRKSAWREKTSTSGTKQTSGISQKDRKVAKMVAMVAGVFFVCGIPEESASIGTTFIKDFGINGKYRDIFIFSFPISGLFVCLNSSINVFIYFWNSSNYREMFTRLYISDKKANN